MDDDALAKKLRRDGKITTSGKPFKEFQRIEIEALIDNGVFRIEPYDSIKYGKFRIFKSRIVNEIKGKATNSLYEKSRMVIQGYSDDGKKMVLIQFPTIQRTSQRVILAMASTLLKQGMHLWLRNITQAYTQSESLLQRTILAYLPEQIRHFYPEGSIIVIIKPLYGIAKAEAY
jgi:hypothetical protein